MINKYNFLARKSWKKDTAFSFISVIIVLLLTKPNIGESAAVQKLFKIKHLTYFGKTHSNTADLDKTFQIVQKYKSSLLNVQDESICQTISNRSKRYVLQGSRWPYKNLTYKISNYPKRLAKSDVDDEISKAFNVWSEYSLLTFTAKTNGSVDIEVRFDDIENGDPFDGPGKVLARSYFPVSGGDVYFDIAEYWTIGNRRGINLFQAAAHEIGHSLGLRHSKSKTALMAPLYRGFNPKFKLDDDDILGIQALYGSKMRG
ncbi:stromelysin-3-like [Episyrphus balteatus]|uniref:stromelysin-3-like n=1 Tax=Episyrphus balteatus TaxID=286459 RepID=UPI002486AAD9|nr:stromelysin-3-like [Episyrphus balteatus]